jgi:hypothetical protein
LLAPQRGLIAIVKILADPNTEIVLKSAGSEEVLRIVYDNSVGFQGVAALYSVIARSVSNSA